MIIKKEQLVKITSLRCRINDDNSKDVIIMMLGQVTSPLTQGVFFPDRDEVQLADKTVIRNYYKDVLNIKYYSPIDKAIFKTAPAGWCTWYYYYQEINENEIKLNAKWLADNLKDYGFEYVNIDDGWQGKGHGISDNRDWTTIDKRFPEDLNSLAAFIKELGLKPGIWIAPQGQSNPEVVKNNKDVFLLNSDNSSASQSWEGDYLVDPSTKASDDYLNKLFGKLKYQGFEFFKIDGQTVVVGEYKDKKDLMRNPGDPELLYRKTLNAIRSSVGDERYILGSWGIPLEGIGIMNGSRTDNDVVLGWSGFKAALHGTLSYGFLNNIVWYNDPDVLLLRAPLTFDQVRAWATLIGLTGQMTLASDRMMDLSEERVDILKKILPAADIKPVDLFPSKRTKKIWNLKVNHLRRNYDIAAIFNFNEYESNGHLLSWKDLGLSETSTQHVFDFWNSEYLGAWPKGFFVKVPPASCRVLTLMENDENIKLISTNRHITQGWVELSELDYNKTNEKFSGVSEVIKEEVYSVSFAFPRGKSFIVKNAVAENFPVTVHNHHRWAEIKFKSPITQKVSWQVEFEAVDSYKYPVSKPNNLSISRIGIDGVRIKWNPQYELNAGFHVYLNGELIGYTPTTEFIVRNLKIDLEHSVIVRAVWKDGTESESSAEIKFNLLNLLLDKLFLDELTPIIDYAGWRIVEMNHSVSGNNISLKGKVYKNGIGTHADSEIVFDLKRLYKKFSTIVGIDDNNGSSNNKIEFFIYGDDRELWKSGVIAKADDAIHVQVNIEGVKKLLLKVTDGGDGINHDYADWADAYVSR